MKDKILLRNLLADYQEMALVLRFFTRQVEEFEKKISGAIRLLGSLLEEEEEELLQDQTGVLFKPKKEEQG